MVSPLSSAMRSATAIALIRRGWVQTILQPGPMLGSSSRNCGTCVDLPHPVSPDTRHACADAGARERRKNRTARRVRVAPSLWDHC